MKLGIELETKARTMDDGYKAKQILTGLFQAHSDASIRTSGTEVGMEWSSIPFTDDNLDYMLGKIEQAKPHLNVDRSCGLHVHVEYFEGDAKQQLRDITNLTKFFYNNQSIILKLVESHREDNHYCAKLNYDMIKPVVEARTINKLYQAIYRHDGIGRDYIKDLVANRTKLDQGYRKGGDRYRTLNLLPILNIHTVEFRLFQATLDIPKIKFYAQLCLAICKKAKETQKVRIYKKTKITGEIRNDTKRLWEFLRSVNLVKEYQYSKSIMRIEQREES